MARKSLLLTRIRNFTFVCFAFVLSQSLLYFYYPDTDIVGISLPHLCLLLFVPILIIYFVRLSKKLKSDSGILSRFLLDQTDDYEIDLRQIGLREFEDLGIAVNTFSEKRSLRLDALSLANDTLSINVNDRGHEITEVNGRLILEIEKQKNTELSLARALKTAESANRAKSEFLSNMRHEIRTPMNAIIGMTDLVLDSDVTSKQKQLLTIVRESGEALLKIINEILDLAKLESGEVILTTEIFVLEDILEVAIRSHDEAAESKGLIITSSIHGDVPGMVKGDYNLLSKVLCSLVNNAVKFTDEGSVSITIKKEELDGDVLVLHFNVTDTGIGIDDDKRVSIFIPFSQIDGSYTRQFEGTGLGLSIAARTVEKMGGIMWLDDDVTVGCSFNFIVRLQKAEFSDIQGNED